MNMQVGFRLKDAEYEQLKQIAKDEQRSIGSMMAIVTRAFIRGYDPETFKTTLEAGKE